MLDYMLRFDDKKLIQSLDEQGRTCLSYAAYMGYHEQVQSLLTAVPHCAYISNKDKSFPIHHAALGGHLSVIDLLSTSSFLLDSRSQNILHLAIITSNFKLVTHLLNFFDVSSLIYQKDDDGNTPLDLAMKLNAIDHDEKVIRRLVLTLERAARGLRSCPIDGNLYQLLIRGEIVRISQITSDKGFDLSDLECIDNGCTILHIAASMNQPFSVMELLRNDCSTSLMYQANNNGDLPIHSAAQAGVLGSLKALLEWSNISTDVCKSMNVKGNTALHIAVSNNQQKMANYLYKQCPEAAYYLNEDHICPLFLAIKIWGASDTVHDMIIGLEGNIHTQSSLMGAKSVVHMAIFTRKTGQF
ncbi:uncharacterized protein LOC130813588 [Amaranthus tricolor]|uniref:uncharacterized protein LOC130813588 n=1 Tax=Amaranthus tricolor TaxID=29722 RepID=UPI00258CC137|nr:uncharacterized protein LOC130813588 [Amaranthus tricolor]